MIKSKYNSIDAFFSFYFFSSIDFLFSYAINGKVDTGQLQQLQSHWN